MTRYPLLTFFAVMAGLTLGTFICMLLGTADFGPNSSAWVALVYAALWFACAELERRKQLQLQHRDRLQDLLVPTTVAMDPRVPPGEAWMIQNGKVVGRIVNLEQPAAPLVGIVPPRWWEKVQ